MADLEVLILDEPSSGGLVSHGASGDRAQSNPVTAAVKKVINISSEQLVDGVTKIAQAIGPSLKEGMKGLSDIAVKEVSIGCTIGAHGTIMIA